MTDTKVGETALSTRTLISLAASAGFAECFYKSTLEPEVIAKHEKAAAYAVRLDALHAELIEALREALIFMEANGSTTYAERARALLARVEKEEGNGR